MRVCVALLCVVVLNGLPSAAARQLMFDSQREEAQLTYQYRWEDSQQAEQELTFTLDAQALARAPGEPVRYTQARVQRYIYVALVKAAREVDPKQARVNITQQNDGVQIAVRSTSQALNQQLSTSLKQTKEAAFDAFLQEHYYTRYTTVFNESAVKPDHARYVAEYTKPLVPLSQAIYEQIEQTSDARRYFDLLLSWVQSIPYDTLEDRSQNSGAGFNPPARLLASNQGDCDSKSVLTAAITRAFLPDTPLILVLLPQHALLGVALTPKKGEQTIDHDGNTYILFEPTGPAQLPFGEVAEQTYRHLANGHYTVEAL